MKGVIGGIAPYLEELKEKHKALRVAVWKQWYEESGLSGNGYYKTDAWKEIQKQVELLLLNNRIRDKPPYNPPIIYT